MIQHQRWKLLSSSEKKGEDQQIKQNGKDKPPTHFLTVNFSKQLFTTVAAFKAPNWRSRPLSRKVSAFLKRVLRMSFYLTDSHVIIHSDHKPLQKFIYAITANDWVNDWSFQIHAICRSINFEYIKGASNVLSDSLSRLSYHELYKKPKPEQEGFEFNKPIVEVDESTYKPVKTAYQDELSVFILSQDPAGNTDSEV